MTISDNDLLIRAVLDSDYEQISAIYDDIDVIGNTSQLPYRTPDFWRAYREKRGPGALPVVAVLDETVVGHMTIVPDERPRRRHVASFGIAVHRDHHRRGIGRALMRELIRLADGWLNLHKLELGVFAHNDGAIALYREFGFVEEGRLRDDLFTDGRYVDTLLMARFRANS